MDAAEPPPGAASPAPSRAGQPDSVRTDRFSFTALATRQEASDSGIVRFPMSDQSRFRISSPAAADAPSSSSPRGSRPIRRASWRSRGPIAIRAQSSPPSSEVRNRIARLKFSRRGEMRAYSMIGSSRSILTVDMRARATSWSVEIRCTLTWFSCASRCAFRRIDAFPIMFASWEHTVCIRYTPSMSKRSRGEAE